MRSELVEPSNHLRRQRTRGERIVQERLEPTAIDAAFADDSLPMLVEPMLRHDEAESIGGPTLIESLRVKLHALEEQHAQIRRMLDEAGHLRLDPAAR
jgi:hypothetical protein